MLRLLALTLLFLSASSPLEAQSGQGPVVYETILQALRDEGAGRVLLLDPRVLVWWTPEGRGESGPWQIRFQDEHPSDWVRMLTDEGMIQGTCQDAHIIGDERTCDPTQDDVVVALSAPRVRDNQTVEVSVLLSGVSGLRPSGQEDTWARQDIYRLQLQSGKWTILSRRTVVRT